MGRPKARGKKVELYLATGEKRGKRKNRNWGQTKKGRYVKNNHTEQSDEEKLAAIIGADDDGYVTEEVDASERRSLIIFSSSHFNNFYCSNDNLRKIEKLLSQVRSRRTIPSKKKEENLAFACLVGNGTTNVRGCRGFTTPHNMLERKHFGVCLTDPMEKKSTPQWLKDLWVLGRELILDVDPFFALGSFSFCS